MSQNSEHVRPNVRPVPNGWSTAIVEEKDGTAKLPSIKGGNPTRWCHHCGFRLCRPNRLRSHYASKHPDEPDPKFLKYGDFPTKCVYTNFEKYLKDPMSEEPTTKKDELRAMHVRVN